MAIMIPDTIREGTVSLAERRLFNRFRRELSDNIYVLHSLGLTSHKNKLWGECDFVIISPSGIFVIEVKGGGVSCQDGLWIYTSRDGSRAKKPEGPFEQAKTAMFAVRDLLIQKNHLKYFLIGYGVVMPDETFTQEGPEIEPNVLLDSRHYESSLEIYLQTLSGFWTKTYYEKHGSTPKFLEKPIIEEVRQLLRPEIRTALTLNSTLCQIEQQQVELTDEQCRILKRMDNNPRTLVYGGAGTGKTIIGMDKAIQKAKANQNELFLCYNRLLGNHLKSHATKTYQLDNLIVNSIHSWFQNVIEEAGLQKKLRNFPDRSTDYFTEHYSEVFIDAFINLGKELFDCIILDEAQDLLRPQYLDALDLVLKNGLSEGNWHFFMDPLQNIFLGNGEDMISQLKKYGLARFDLTVNCRNTKGVAVMTSIISGIDVPIEGAIEGGKGEVKFFSNQEQLLNDLERTLEKLLFQGIRRDDIIVLSCLKLKNSSLSGINKLYGQKVSDLTGDTDYQRGIQFCTFQGFKGLEKKIVIAIDLVDLESDSSRLLHYCGLSRARAILIIFLAEKDKSVYDRLAYEFGERVAEKSTQII